MSTTIYIPYFYIIQHINSGKYYAGVKYAENSNPDTLLQPNGYQTSSEVVKQIIHEEGLDSFIIRRIKIFETREDALDYELRFLRRVNASFNKSFLNMTNNSFSNLNINYDKRCKTCLEKYGVENPFQNEEIKEKIKQSNLEKYGVEYPIQLQEFQEKRKQTCLKKYGVENVMQSNIVQEKHKQTCIKNYGVEHAFQNEEVKEKYKQTCIKNYGVEHAFQNEEVKEKITQTLLTNYGYENAMHSPELKEKHCQTLFRNFGVNNPSKSPEIQEKKRQTHNNLMNNPTIVEIKKYRDKFKLKLGYNWFRKKQEELEDILENLKIVYGEIEVIENRS